MAQTPPIPTDTSRAACEAHYLLNLPEGGWSNEDLRFSESAQLALVTGDGSLTLVSNLYARHQAEARRMNASELSGWPQNADPLAQRKAGAKLDLLRAVERVERKVQMAARGGR